VIILLVYQIISKQQILITQDLVPKDYDLT